MLLEEWKFQQWYEGLPEWRKFLFSWRACWRIGGGWKVIYQFPRSYFRLRRALRKLEKNPELERQIVADLNKNRNRI